MRKLLHTLKVIVVGTAYSFVPQLVIKKVKFKAVRHRTMMIGEIKPAWWQWMFGIRKRTMAFVGFKSRWYVHPTLQPLPQWMAKQLENREKKFLIYGK